MYVVCVEVCVKRCGQALGRPCLQSHALQVSWRATPFVVPPNKTFCEYIFVIAFRIHASYRQTLFSNPLLYGTAANLNVLLVLLSRVPDVHNPGPSQDELILCGKVL